ncbi:hypothetical protein NMY22_g13384 [Coprinellus aureogranulatus]|nr:hypothetical protein NMY22_g13384 [Coprinellus aureogranulatus]
MTSCLQKDGIYYWANSVTFSVESTLFKVPRFQFITGSRHFAEKHGIDDEEPGVKKIVRLEGVLAADFRVFLAFLFPIPSNTPIALIFTKDEWLTILELCTKWHFPEFRALAIQSLDGKLTELEQIHLGRALYIPAFLKQGYKALIQRPKDQIITQEEAATIGHEAANKLWIIRFQLHVSGTRDFENFVDRELLSSFAEELAELERREGEAPGQADVSPQRQTEEKGKHAATECSGGTQENGSRTGNPAMSWADDFESTEFEPPSQSTGWGAPETRPEDWGLEPEEAQRTVAESPLEEHREQEGISAPGGTPEKQSLGQQSAGAGEQEHSTNNSAQAAERRRKLEEELEKIRHTKQSYLKKEEMFKAQKAEYSRKLKNVDRLIRRGGTVLPATAEKRERKQKKFQAKLLTIETELKELTRLLITARAQEKKLENEVEDVLFKVPRFQFAMGSRHFSEKYGLCDDGHCDGKIVHLSGVSAAQFRVFLAFLFPIPSNTPIASIFTKDEWLTILSLCTRWNFPEFRALAIQSLDGKLTELELIHIGRAFYIPDFLKQGYRAIVERHKDNDITEEEAAAIGHEATNKLWIIRFQHHISGSWEDEDTVEYELLSEFGEELMELARRECEIQAKVEVEGAIAADEANAEVRQPQEEAQRKRDWEGYPSAPWEAYYHPLHVRPLSKLEEEHLEPIHNESLNHAWGWETPPGDAAVCGTQSDDPTATEWTALRTTLEQLREQERDLTGRLKEKQAWGLHPKAADNIEEVTKARNERIAEELRNIEEAKQAEEDIIKPLKSLEAAELGRQQSTGSSTQGCAGVDARVSVEELEAQLEDTMARRVELEKLHISNTQKGPEDGELVKLTRSSQRRKRRAVVKLKLELLECRTKLERVEEQLLTLAGLENHDREAPGGRAKPEDTVDV